MKKVLAILIVIVLAAGFAACGTPVANKGATPSAEAQTATEPTQALSDEEPTPVSIETSDEEPEYESEFKEEPDLHKEEVPELELEQPQMPQNKDEVLFSMLENPQELWSEGSDGFAENQGGEFGGGAAEKRYNENEERLELFSDDNGACVPFNTRLRDCGQDNRAQQAVIVKFHPENVADFRFSFEAMSEMTISFREDGPYLVDVAEFFETTFSDFMPSSFELKNTSQYNILFAVDENAIMRVLVWEEGIIENQAYIEYDLYHGADDVYDSNWQMFIGFGANGQLNIYEYWVYTFDRFMDNPLVIAQGE